MLVTGKEIACDFIVGEHYGLSRHAYRLLVLLHCEGNEEVRKRIEYILTDINYHKECSALHRGDYADALELYDRVE